MDISLLLEDSNSQLSMPTWTVGISEFSPWTWIQTFGLVWRDLMRNTCKAIYSLRIFIGTNWFFNPNTALYICKWTRCSNVLTKCISTRERERERESYIIASPGPQWPVLPYTLLQLPAAAGTISTSWIVYSLLQALLECLFTASSSVGIWNQWWAPFTVTGTFTILAPPALCLNRPTDPMP
jgi:hypothetical protein